MHILTIPRDLVVLSGWDRIVLSGHICKFGLAGGNANGNRMWPCFKGLLCDVQSAAEIKKEEEQSPGGKAVSDEEMGRQLAPPPKRRKSGGEQEKLATPRNDTGGRYFAQ